MKHEEWTEKFSQEAADLLSKRDVIDTFPIVEGCGLSSRKKR